MCISDWSSDVCSSDLPGQAVRLGGVIIRLRACEATPAWEKPPLIGAFLQVDTADTKGRFHRTFSGWTYAETPSLNPVAHPVYDVWVKSCAMRFTACGTATKIGRATCRERVCQNVSISVVAVELKKKNNPTTL